MKLIPFAPSHAQAFYELTHDEGFSSFSITNYRQESLASAESWIEKNQELLDIRGLGKWGVFLDDQLIGMGGLTPWQLNGQELVDITYRLKKSFHGKGLGRKLAKCLFERGVHEMNLSNLSATITPDNIVSLRIIESMGFKFEKEIELFEVRTLLYLL